MIVPQVALSLVKLNSAALVVRGIERLLRADPGLRSDGVFTVRVRTPPEFFPKINDAIAFQIAACLWMTQEVTESVLGMSAKFTETFLLASPARA